MALFATLAAAAAPKIGKLIKQSKEYAASPKAASQAGGGQTASAAGESQQSGRQTAPLVRPDGLYKEDNGDFTRLVNGQSYVVKPYEDKYNGIKAEYYEDGHAQSPDGTKMRLAQQTVPVMAANAADTFFASSGERQYARGGTGKEYSYNPLTGNIGVTRPDGSFAYVSASDPQYALTKQAVLTDIDAYQRSGMLQTAGGAGQMSAAAANPYTNLQQAIGQGDMNAAAEQLIGQFLPELASTANGDYLQQLNSYRQSTLDYEQALALARRYLQGQYTAAAENSADAAAQRLDRAGIYDSLYGQALAMNAEQSAHQAVEQEAAELAAQLVGFNRQQVMDLLQLNQNAAEVKLAAQESTMSYILQLMKQLAAQAAAERNEAARQGLWEIENDLRRGLIKEGEALYLIRNLLS